MEQVIKPGAKIIKTLIWYNVENDAGWEVNRCELKFNNGAKLTYECYDIPELLDKHKGIYELLEDGTYIQIEDWEE